MLKKILVGTAPELDESELIRAHRHYWAALLNVPVWATRWPEWEEVTDKPLDFPPAPHDASLITSGTLSLDRLPAGALERLVFVDDQPARFALTTSSVQTGDTVQQLDTGVMYRVVDDTQLNSALGYVEYTAARASAVAWGGVENPPATATRWPEWSEVTSKPATFPPSTHSHGNADITAVDWSKLTNIPAFASRWPTWTEVTSKPTTFAPSAHTHPWSEITSQPTTLSGTVNLTGDQTVAGTKTFSAYPIQDTTADSRYRLTHAGVHVAQIQAVPGEMRVAQTGAGKVGLWVNGVERASVDNSGDLRFTGTLQQGTVPWARLSDIPAFASRWPTWSEVTSKPTTFAPSAHTHPFTDVTGSLEVSRLTETPLTMGNISLTNRALFDVLRADRTVFLPAEQIIIEQSTDGGTTWVDAGVSDLVKRQLFTGARPNLAIPLKGGVKSTDCLLRVTITAMRYNQSAATGETDRYNYWNSSFIQSTERYCNLDAGWIWLSSNADRIYCTVQRATGANPSNWVTDREGLMTGWAGGNGFSLSGNTFGGGTSQVNNWWNWRFIFRTAPPNGSFDDADLTTTHPTSVQFIHHIKLAGRNVWTMPNSLMYRDHLYSWDHDQNATFPAGVAATAFTEGGTALASKYVGLTGNQTIAGTKTFSSEIYSQLASATLATFERTGTANNTTIRFKHTGGEANLGITSALALAFGPNADVTNAGVFEVSAAGVLNKGTVPWARLSDVPATFPATPAFGIGQATQPLADLTSTDANLGRIFRNLAGDTGGPGVSISGVILPFDGSPTTNYIGVTPDVTPRLFLGRKAGAAATPTWREVAYDNQVVKLTGDQSVSGAKTFTTVVLTPAGFRSEGVGLTDLDGATTDIGRLLPIVTGFQASNRVAGANYTTALQFNHNTAGWRSQIGMATLGGDPRLFIRHNPNTTWSGWRELAYDDQVVKLTGNQTIAGIKTFSDTPTIDGASAARLLLSVASTPRGSVYANASNQVGFLNQAGSWSWRVASDGTLEVGTVPWARLSDVPSTFAPSAHTHAWADITSGVPAFATRWPTISEVTGKATLTRGTGLTGNNFDGTAATTWAVSYGSAAGTACQGNDARLSDARTPLAHSHTAADLPESNRVGVFLNLTSQTLAAAHRNGIINHDNATAYIYTLPSGSAAFDVGDSIQIHTSGTGTSTIRGSTNSQSIRRFKGSGAPVNNTTDLVMPQGSVVTLTKVAASQWNAFGGGLP